MKRAELPVRQFLSRVGRALHKISACLIPRNKFTPAHKQALPAAHVIVRQAEKRPSTNHDELNKASDSEQGISCFTVKLTLQEMSQALGISEYRFVNILFKIS